MTRKPCRCRLPWDDCHVCDPDDCDEPPEAEPEPELSENPGELPPPPPRERRRAARAEPMIVRIQIPGLPPTVNGRKMIVNGKPMNRPEVASFHASAAYAGLAAMRRAGVLNPFDAPVVALISYRVALSRRRDSDASTKDVLDGLQRVAWVNDRLVVRHCPRVLPAEVYGAGSALECTIVHVTAAGEDPDAAMAGLLLGGLT